MKAKMTLIQKIWNWIYSLATGTATVAMYKAVGGWFLTTGIAAISALIVAIFVHEGMKRYIKFTKKNEDNNGSI